MAGRKQTNLFRNERRHESQVSCSWILLHFHKDKFPNFQTLYIKAFISPQFIAGSSFPLLQLFQCVARGTKLISIQSITVK